MLLRISGMSVADLMAAGFDGFDLCFWGGDPLTVSCGGGCIGGMKTFTRPAASLPPMADDIDIWLSLISYGADDKKTF